MCVFSISSLCLVRACHAGDEVSDELDMAARINGSSHCVVVSTPLSMAASAQDPALAVRCRNLVKRYADVTAVDGLDLDVRKGECFGLLGPNGAGKTTTIEILEGLTEPDAGEVEILGSSWRRNGRELRERLGISLQETQLNEKLTVGEIVRLFRSFYRR